MGKRYETLSDEALIEQLRGGDREIMDFLMEKYKNLVRRHANTMFLLGGDTDDVIQEGMIGLFKAIRDFDPAMKSTFFHFADLCISRQIYTAIEAASRKKHGPLNSYISLYESDRGLNDEQNPMLLQADVLTNPEELVIGEENAKQFLKTVRESLSNMENQVLSLYLEGMNYRQIAEKMGRDEKSIDNALQRIRSKISRIL